MNLGEWTFRAFHDGRIKLDGGAMFGVVPKVFWEKHHPADEKNRITLDLRCLLVDHGDRRILVDTGMGDRWNEKQVGIFGVERRPHQLVAELAEAGITRESITDVIFTHLHFDHSGGALQEKDGVLSPVFANARHWIQKRQWEWANKPSERDQASFRQEDFAGLADDGKLELVDGLTEIIPGVRVTPINGHTPGQQIVEFHTGQGVVAFVGDLLPMMSQTHIPWIMGFDLNPLLTVSEKKQFLTRAVEDQYIVVFEHDIVNEAATIKFVDGKFKADQVFTLDDAPSLA
ncbi:MAG: glyoxylase-like metal-dependent hydrolase (beta-lactamase superfamily II) [Candidatus Krumholzibacteriia bacterium]|jgi:glyoxylase-like metal-dependent hydrolase (beta-lactamase superfamily II)